MCWRGCSSKLGDSILVLGFQVTLSLLQVQDLVALGDDLLVLLLDSFSLARIVLFKLVVSARAWEEVEVTKWMGKQLRTAISKDS